MLPKRMQPVRCQWCEKVLNKNKGSNHNTSDYTLILQCSACRRVSYCDGQCQRKDWPLHQTRCGDGVTTTTTTTTTTNDNKQFLSSFEEVCDAMTQMPHSLDTASKRNAVIQVLGSEEPLHLFWSRFVEVRRSEYVHGRGLFLADFVDGRQQQQYIPAGAAITCYPVHLLFDDKGKVVRPVTTKRGIGGQPNPITASLQKMTAEEIRALIDSHGVSMGTQTAVGLPDLCQEKRLLGHMVNDACLVDVFSSWRADELKDDMALLKRLIVTLLKNAIKYTNCAFLYDARHLVRVLVARREIRPGEELLVSYGIGYWLEKNYGPNYSKRYPFITENIQKLLINDIEVQRLLTQTALQLDMPVLLTEMKQQQQQQTGRRMM